MSNLASLGVGGAFNPFTALDVVYAHRGESLVGTLAHLDPVSSWTDEGEGTHTATQGTAARQPIFHEGGGPNDLPYLTFDGTDDNLAIAAVSEAQPVTHFFVFNDPTPSDANSLILVNGTVARQQIWVGFNVLKIFAGTTINGSSPGGTWRVLTVTFANGAASNAWLEHTQVMTNVDAGSNGYAGALYGQSAGGGHDGSIEEAWCIRGDPGSSLRTEMINYLMARTGIADAIVAWGDSLTSGTGGTSYPTQLSAMYTPARTATNKGVGGDTSSQTLTRILANDVEASNIAVFWMGRNNYTNPTQVKSDIASAIAHQTSGKYVVLSVINGNFANEYSGQSGWTTITTLNSDLAALYPDNYIDVRAALVAAYDSGVPQDVTDHANDVPPSSLRSDAIHLNTAGYAIVAAQVASFIRSKGW